MGDAASLCAVVVAAARRASVHLLARVSLGEFEY